MTRTYLSAVFANADETAAVAQTAEAGAVALSLADTPAAWAAMLEAVTPTPYAPLPAAVPELTARQLRLGLLSLGVAREHVEAAIAAIPDPQARAVAEIEWEYANTFPRLHPLVAAIGGALGLTTEQIDTAWAWAAAQ